MSDGTSPLIVIGMHRSGTTLLSRLLQRTGVFMGARTNRNAEAHFTNAVNGWLFAQASATWDRPEGMDDLLADDALGPWLIDYVGGIVRGPAAVRFTGVRRFARWRGLDRIDVPWGWKDPRNTYTLGLWLELFPGARVVHIVRHGVDVAASLRTRRERAVAANLARYRRLRRLYLLRPDAPKRRGFGPQPRSRTLEGGLEMWTQYVDRARAHVDALGERSLELSYESLLADPRGQLARVLAHAGVEAHGARLAAATAGLDAARAHAWHGDAEKAAFAERVRPQLEARGFGADPP